MGGPSSHFPKTLIYLVGVLLRRLKYSLIVCHTGTMAAAYVNGLQSEGVSASSYLVSGLPHHIIYIVWYQPSSTLLQTIKSTSVRRRTLLFLTGLSEKYICIRAHMLPFYLDRYSYRRVRFMLAQKYAQPGAYMTS